MYTEPPSLDNATLPEQDDEQEEEMPPGAELLGTSSQAIYDQMIQAQSGPALLQSQSCFRPSLTVEPLQFLSEEEVVDTDSDLENV